MPTLIFVENMLPPEKIAQHTKARFGWDTTIAPVIEAIQEGPDFQSVNTAPEDFMKASEQIAGENARLMTKLFEAITHNRDVIGSSSVYSPYIYDTQDPNHPQVLGLKMSSEGAYRLADVRLELPPETKLLTLTVQNFRFYKSFGKKPPSLVISADDKQITINRNQGQSIPDKEQWLDEEFHQFLDSVITRAQQFLPTAS